jgi:hypothetical protein
LVVLVLLAVLPRYFDGRWMTKFRGHYCVDGGVMAFIPTVAEADYTVKVRWDAQRWYCASQYILACLLA